LNIYGSDPKSRSSEKLLAAFSEVPVVEENRAFRSYLKLPKNAVYPEYKIKLTQGGVQNRLLLRALNADFWDKDPLLNLAHEVSRLIPYGKGVASVAKGRDIIKDLMQSTSAHCRNYALLFVTKLPLIHIGKPTIYVQIAAISIQLLK
jgi:hypothetical protein